MMKIIRTSRNGGERLSSSNLVNDTPDTGKVSIIIDPSIRYQTIRGFGGAFTESAAYTLSRMPEQVRGQIIRDYFDPADGNGYVLGRTHIHSCDFSLENYSYVDDGDRDLSSFDISREKNWTIPLIRDSAAVAGRDLELLASPWSPPAWMKTNGKMNNGGKLLEEFRPVWAQYYVRYLRAMEEEGIRIEAITVQNEPAAVQTWDSCLYTASEERDFVKNHLGPVLEAAGLGDIRIIIWDHNRDLIVERARTVLSDPDAASYIWGVGNHWYVSEEFENLSRVHQEFPDIHLLFTEGCQEGGVHLGAWHTGERYGRNIIGDLSNWVEGWMDWNLVLDETGGPNHVGNYCDAPIIADTVSGEYHKNSSYYYIGHFSRFVRPGSVRIASQIEQVVDGLHQIAFRSPDGQSITVAMNESDIDLEINWILDNRYFEVYLPAHSIVTGIISSDLSGMGKGDVPVQSGPF